MDGIATALWLLIFVGLVGIGVAFGGAPIRRLLANLRRRWGTPASLVPLLDAEELTPDEPVGGNIPMVSEERGKAPDPASRYAFPTGLEPTTRYEDLNRRLFVAADADLPGDVAPARGFRDYPAKLAKDADLDKIAMTFRDWYPVISDPAGNFARFSAILEYDPHYDHPLLAAYLALAPQARPVVLSGKAAEKLPDAYALKLYRWQFETFIFNSRFAIAYPRDSFDYLFKCLTGEPKEWFWFSPARLRKHVTDLNRPREEHARAEQQAAQEAAERLRHMLDPKNRFEALWAQRSDRALTDAPESQDKADRPA